MTFLPSSIFTLKHSIPIKYIVIAIFWVLLVISFIIFSIYQSNQIHKQTVTTIRQHANVVQASLWAYNKNIQLAYLEFAIQAGHYNDLIITDDAHEVFLSLDGVKLSPFDELLHQSGLLPFHEFSADIQHNTRKIGTLTVTWHSRIFYTHFSFFIIWLLTGIGVTLLFRVTWAKQLLQKKSVELIKAKELAEIASKAKSNFLANMSHEIRTPMNAIIGLTSLTLEKQISEDLRYDLDKVNYSANHLLNIINDILDLSKIEAGKLQPDERPFLFDELVTNLKSIFDIRSKEQGIDFTINGHDLIPKILSGDDLKLTQILINICGNAIKFTRQGQVDLSFSHTVIDDQNICITFTITDTGIGMSTDDIDKIFNAFEQADASITRHYGGTGLGLSISRHLIQLMNGTVNVTSNIGKGTEFIIELPFGTLNDDQLYDIALLRHNDLNYDFTTSRILLVEDNKINQHIALSILKQTGADIELADDGLQALLALDTRQFDIVLMDIQMPNMDGLEATREIRSHNTSYRNIPIIAMTAHAMDEDIKLCIASGMNDHVSKPIIKQNLFSVLAKHLEVTGTALAEPSNTTIEPEEYTPDEDDLNLSEGIERLGGNKSLYMSILGTFLSEHKSDGNNLIHLYNSNQHTEFNNLIHTLKSVTGNLSINRLYKLTAEINDLRKLQPNAEVDTDTLLDIYNRALVAVENTLKDYQNAKQ